MRGQPRPDKPREDEDSEQGEQGEAETRTRDDCEDEGYTSETEPAAIILEMEIDG